MVNQPKWTSQTMELVGSHISIPNSKDKSKHLIIRATKTNGGALVGFINGLQALLTVFPR